MANPITWQNIQTPSQGNPAQFMQLATNGIDGAFDKLQGVLKQRETTDQANWNQIGVNNAEAFKSALYGMTTPDQMAAAQKSGQFNEMLASYGANVKDPGALRALMDGRLATLQKQTTDGIVYGNTVLEQTNAPKLEEYRTASPERRAEIVAQNPGMRGLGAVVQDTQKFGWAGDEAAAKKALAPFTQETARTGALLSASQAKHYDSKTNEDAGVKALTAAAGTAAMAYASKVDTLKKDAGKWAGSLGLPVTEFGTPDISRMDKGQKEALDGLLVKNGLPAWGQMPDDAVGLQSFIQSETAKGTPAHLLLGGKAAAEKLFADASLATPTGAGTATAKAKEDRAAEVLKERNLKDGIVGSGSSEPLRNIDSVVKYIDARHKPGSPEHKSLMASVIREASKTTKVGDKEVGYPLDLITSSIAEAEGGRFFGEGNYGLGNWSGENAVKLMQDKIKDPKYLKAIAERDNIDINLLTKNLETLSNAAKDSKVRVKGKDDKPATHRSSALSSLLNK